jgi:hypothetical protein
MRLLLRSLLFFLAYEGLAVADPEVSEGTILELLDPETGERTMGYAYDMELAPAVKIKRQRDPRPPFTQRSMAEPVICWVEFSPRPSGLPGRVEIKDDCPPPFSRAVRRASRKFRFFPYEATGTDPIHVHRMVFGAEPVHESTSEEPD